MSFFGTGGRGPANREMPTEVNARVPLTIAGTDDRQLAPVGLASMIKNRDNRPEQVGRSPVNRTPRSAYFEVETVEPQRPAQVYYPADGREGNSSGQGYSFGQGHASEEGTPANYREARGIEFGKGFEERKQARNQTTEVKKPAPVSQQPEPRTVMGLSSQVARSGIVLAEILGPPKGRAYFNRRFGR